jgi:hypothetical protein
MTCTAEIRRRYQTGFEAWRYLASRGFTRCADSVWVNGRWIASVQHAEDGVDVTVWLRLQPAA